MHKSHKVFLFILIFFFNTLNLNAEEKITYLNIDFVIQNSNLGKSILKNLNNLDKENKKKFELREKKLRQIENDLINKKNILSKDELETNIEKLKKDMNQFNLDRKKVNFEYNEKRKKAINNFLQKITPLIENYVKKNSISLVLNQKNIFIGSKKYDITNDIIEIVNQNFN
tara:strand:- start:462 stop:974 length:513 start_codon:yes stop_codon:yes gene_type:complete